jgi:hypothetical protein
MGSLSSDLPLVVMRSIHRGRGFGAEIEDSLTDSNSGGEVSALWQAQLPALLFAGRRQSSLELYIDLIVNKKPKSRHIEGTS